MNTNPTDAQLEVLLRTFWSQNYPSSPPGSHVLMTHIGFARFLLQKLGQQQREQSHG